jgi:hypothetical protein
MQPGTHGRRKQQQTRFDEFTGCAEQVSGYAGDAAPEPDSQEPAGRPPGGKQDQAQHSIQDKQQYQSRQ